jgi:YVTN family beta-propeller protein
MNRRVSDSLSEVRREHPFMGYILITVLLLIGLGGFAEPIRAAPFAYLTHSESPQDSHGRVTVIDTATHRVKAEVPIDGQPGNVAVHPAASRVYVATNDGNTVTVIDTATNTVIDTIPMLEAPTAVAVHPVGTSLYVARARSEWLTVIDTITHLTIADVQMPHSGAIAVEYTQQGPKST